MSPCTTELGGGPCGDRWGVRPERPRHEGERRHPVRRCHIVPDPNYLLQRRWRLDSDAKWFPSGEPIYENVSLEWLSHIFREPNIPQTISTSYGGREQNIPPEYARALCDLFKFIQLGSRGVSVLY